MADAARLDWIKEKACNGLNVPAALFTQHLEGESTVALITKFLDDGKEAHLHLEQFVRMSLPSFGIGIPKQETLPC